MKPTSSLLSPSSTGMGPSLPSGARLKGPRPPPPPSPPPPPPPPRAKHMNLLKTTHKVGP